MQLFSTVSPGSGRGRLSTGDTIFPPPIPPKLKRKSWLKKEKTMKFVGRHPINKPHKSKVWT